jgi:hypothetical protein
MSNPIQPVHGVNAQAETQQAPPPPKNQQPAAPNALPQDKVTLSPQAQTLAAKPNQGGGQGNH